MIPLFQKTWLFAFLLFLPVFASSVFCADFRLSRDTGGKEGPLVIKSNSLEIDNDKKTVTFRGNVDARNDDWVMNCNEMILIYSEQREKADADAEKLRVDRIVAKGAVRIMRPLGGEAAAEEAVYYQAEERVVLTGKPIVRQGEDFVEGSRITLFLRDNRSIVEGSEENKVRAVIAPRSVQR